ncbi:ATP-binding protein [archaeon]|nr:ATP-binding protein [archaeon]
MKGIIISGDFENICIRKKSSTFIELGELMIAENNKGKVLLQVFNLAFGSQLSQQQLEFISGLKIEESNDLKLMDQNLRNYNLAFAKSLLFIENDVARACKTLPGFFSEVREVRSEDLKFLSKPENALCLGDLRSGSQVLDFPLFVDGKKVFSHHVLISGTTGRGKSVLMNNILWGVLWDDYCGLLVLDPHDEYYGKAKFGLKNHPNARRKLVYYSQNNVPIGERTLKINIKLLKPKHFQGVVYWSDAQSQALQSYYKEHKEEWIESIVLEKPLQVSFHEATLSVLKRIILNLLNLSVVENKIQCKGVFDLTVGETTIKDITNDLKNKKTVIINTNNFNSQVELLIGSIISHELFSESKENNDTTISIVLEEAPRVLGKSVLEKGNNIFATIAREGRKFNIGLTAITQLPSLIPREILANLNTKILLGTELKQERQALIESAAQDLSKDDRNIASLDKGEAIITSTFTKFAIPVKIPFFSEEMKKEEKINKNFEEMT